ncbi:hypothetical protein V8B97DRAFT_1915901 [Scleroderma yunnanense]
MDMSSTKAISSDNMFLKKIEDLDRETDIFTEDMDDSCIKELDLQQEEHTAQTANAEVIFCCQHDLKVLDLEMKKVKENTISQQIELLCLQIQFKNLEQPSLSSSTVLSSSTTAESSAN